MSREFLFRAWSPKYKKFLKRYEYPNGHSAIWMDVEDGELNHLEFDGKYGISIRDEPFEDVILSQFTGLLDISKNKIFEGDILLCHEYDSSDTGGGRILQTFTNAVVGFTLGSFYYFPKGNMQQPHQLLMYAYRPKVIGNVYENPELLTN